MENGFKFPNVSKGKMKDINQLKLKNVFILVASKAFYSQSGQLAGRRQSVYQKGHGVGLFFVSSVYTI